MTKKPDHNQQTIQSPEEVVIEKEETTAGISRRNILKGAAALSAATLFPTLGKADIRHSRAPTPFPITNRPNIIFILVDEMRFPSQFPAGIETPSEFLEKFMPNTYSLWSKGVKFARHYSAANDCSPSRGVIVTGLYSHQTWCVNTLIYRAGATHAMSPPLNSAFPTYGKLLRAAGYQTPYIGKWHLSVPHDPDSEDYLEDYGFQSFINPDPTGTNLQGTYGDEDNGYFTDAYIAQKAVEWLNSDAARQGPWCLTVGFQNPHDKEFFPAGTEFQSWAGMYADSTINPNGYKIHNDYSSTQCGNSVSWDLNDLKNPPSYGYDAVPTNWETLDQISNNKPGWQSVAVQLQALIWGGVSFDPNQTGYVMEQYPTTPGEAPSEYGILRAPFNYWQRSLDSYTQIMELLDQNIGDLLQGMPESLAKNTIVVFSSDHGDYAGSHGMVSGKTGSFYNECANVPLIVVDPTGRYTNDIDVIRTGITSHVDILPMLVSFAYNGSKRWMQGDLAALYGNRHNLIPMLGSRKAAGRKAAYFATDETITANLNFELAPEHILGMVTDHSKVVVYCRWNPNSTTIAPRGQQREYYDYTTEMGRAEIESLPDSAAAKRMARTLLTDGLDKEIRKPLPWRYWPAQRVSQRETIAFFKLNLMSLLGD